MQYLAAVNRAKSTLVTEKVSISFRKRVMLDLVTYYLQTGISLETDVKRLNGKLNDESFDLID